MSELKLAQIVDYDIQTDDYLVGFRHFSERIEGLSEFVWLSKKQEEAVWLWWHSYGNSGDMFTRKTFSLRKKELPEEYHFWKQLKE